MKAGTVIAKTLLSLLIVLLAFVAGVFGLLMFYFLQARPVLFAFVIAAYIDLVAIMILCVWSPRLIRKLRFIPLILLGVCVVSAGILGGYWIWEESLPQVSDQLILREYEPFAAESNLARLEEPATLRLAGNLPRLDCATALYPLMAAFVEAVYPPGEYSPYDSKSIAPCGGTTTAYERLIAGEADIILVAQPSDQQLQMARDEGIELVMTPIGLEAFVFFVNTANPVDGLTAQQIRGIYSGELTTWGEVGGRSGAIRAFQRPKNSGSQTALEHFMGDVPLMEAPEENMVSLMGGIIRRAASYRNYGNAIGYSFRYYSTQMVKNNQIKLLAIDGVFPTREAIRDGSYPIASPYYAITVKERDNEQNRVFIHWILSDQGRYLTEETGYISIPDV